MTDKNIFDDAFPQDKQVGGNHYTKFPIQPYEFISKNDLENVVSIKNDELLKIILPNEVIYLNVKSYGKIDPINIKQNMLTFD